MTKQELLGELKILYDAANEKDRKLMDVVDLDPDDEDEVWDYLSEEMGYDGSYVREPSKPKELVKYEGDRYQWKDGIYEEYRYNYI